MNRMRSRAPRKEELFSKNSHNKTRSKDEIAIPKAARFAPEAMKPFEPHFLHPARCAIHRPCKEVERRADAKQHSANRGSIFYHPIFLFWCAHPNPDDVWRCGAD